MRLREETERDWTEKEGILGRSTNQTMRRITPKIIKTAINAAKKRRKKVASG